jgi:tetratricopeptide (TPR) repeat protein
VASSISADSDDEAESLLKRSIQLAADTLDQSRALLGDYYYRTSRYTESEESYRRALAIRENHEGDPSIPQDGLLLSLSRSLYHMERIEEAMSYAAQAVLENSANNSARDFLNFLSSKTEHRSIQNGSQK